MKILFRLVLLASLASALSSCSSTDEHGVTVSKGPFAFQEICNIGDLAA